MSVSSCGPFGQRQKATTEGLKVCALQIGTFGDQLNYTQCSALCTFIRRHSRSTGTYGISRLQVYIYDLSRRRYDYFFKIKAGALSFYYRRKKNEQQEQGNRKRKTKKKNTSGNLSCQQKDGDMNNVFSFQIQPCTP